MSVLDLGDSSAEADDLILSIDFSVDGEMLVTLELDALGANTVELLDGDGQLVQCRRLHPAQVVAVLPLRDEQPVEYELVDGGRISCHAPHSERQRIDLGPGDPLEPGDYQVAVGRPDGPTQRRDITISADWLPDGD